MKRTFPWILMATLFVAFVASFSELQRMRKRFGEVTRPVLFHVHADVRQFIIRSELDGLLNPIVVLGDSLAEMARFPETICQEPVVNAGIGGSTTADLLFLAPKLLKHLKQPTIVIATGANDNIGSPDSLIRDLGFLLSYLKRVSRRVILVPTSKATDIYKTVAAKHGVDFVSTSIGETPPDGIHYSREGSKRWALAIVNEIKMTGCD